MDQAAQLRRILGGELKENEVLRPYSLLQVGGVADFFYDAKTIEELVTAVSAACAAQVPYVVFGGGSHTVFSDYGFPGLVIRNGTSNISFIAPISQVIVDSGVNTARLVMEAAGKDLGGIEFLATVPGTVGGAVVTNDGNFGFTIGSLVKTVTVLLPPDRIAAYPVKWLEPAYSTTHVRTTDPRPIVLAVKLQLQHYKKEEIVRKIAHYQKLAVPTRQGSSIITGPVFRNPSGEPSRIGDDPDKSARSASGVVRQLNVQRLRVGGAAVYANDPNRLMLRNAKAQDIRELISQVKKLAAENLGVRLVETLEYVGKWE